MYALVFAIVFLLTFFKLYIFRPKLKQNDKGERIYGLEDIPGEKPIFREPFIGNLIEYLPFSQSLKQGQKVAEKHGGLFKVVGANQAFVIITSPDIIQQIFKSTDFGHNIKSPIVYDTMKPFITNGVLVSTKTFWQQQRKILMKTQSYQNLKLYIKMMNKHSQHFVQELENLFENGQPNQINEAINVLFLRIICEMITGASVNSESEFDRYHQNFQLWKASLVKRMLNPWLLLNPLWKLHPMSRDQDRAVKEMVHFAKQRIREHQTANGIEQKESTFRSVLDELTDAGVPENQIVDELNTMLFGGHETGASTIHFFCFEMALNPEIQQLCQQEVDQTFENPEYFKNGQLTFEAANSGLKFVERCLLETMRLYPAIFLFFRKLETPMTIEHNSRKYLLPVGTNLGVTPFVMQRRSEYFPNPEVFNPDRFLPEEVAKRHSYAFVPFSGGPRSCLGTKFAMLEMKLVAAYVLRRFKMITTDKSNDIGLLPFITLTPERDYTFVFQKRFERYF